MNRPIRLPALVLGGLVALAGPAVGQGEAQGVTGDLVPCYIGQDLTDEEHQACANLCMELAVPLVLVAEDGHVYVPTGADSDKLSGHAREPVEIQGTVGEQAECRTLAVDRIQTVKAPEPRPRTGNAFTATLITDDDLEQLRNMSVYELLRQHSRVRIQEFSGIGEIILCEEREVVGTYRGCPVYLNERRAHDPIATVRDLRIHDVRRLEILRRTEASSRYGGHGYTGVVVIRTRR